MKLRYSLIVLYCTILVAGPAQNPNDLLKSTFAKMDAAAASFKGMTADVKKVSHFDAIGENDVSTGTMTVKRAHAKDLRMRADLQQPDRRLVCFADRKGQIFNPKTNTVQIYDVSKKNTVMAEQLLLLGFGSSAADVESGYSVKLGGEETINGQKAVRLELIPKSHDLAVSFPKVELWISEAGENSGVAVQQKFHQQANDYLMATYTNMKFNPNLPDSAVKCDLPKDVQKEYPMGH